MRRAILAGAAALGLGACSSGIDEARNADVTSLAYGSALHAGYLSLAETEASEGDNRDAEGFAQKAFYAADGAGVGPETVNARRVPAEERDAVTGRLASLLTMFDRGGRTLAPDKTATAQVQFDCWVQELEENIQADDIAACRDRFDAVVAELDRELPADRETGSVQIPGDDADPEPIGEP